MSRCAHRDWKGRRCRRGQHEGSMHVYRLLRSKGDSIEYRETRREVLTTAGELCRAAIRDVCTGKATQVHHLVRRSQGGTDERGNLCAICAECHQHIHSNPEWAYSVGLLYRARDHATSDALLIPPAGKPGEVTA